MLFEWAKKWGIPEEALEDLKKIIIPNNSRSIEGTSEAAVMSRIKLEASQKQARLWRNNVGATYTKEGDFLRYGLANESTAQNKLIKSGDLIGIQSVLITPEMVGTRIGRFISREVKKAGWIYRNTETEKAQFAWATFINIMGGDARIVTGEGDL